MIDPCMDVAMRIYAIVDDVQTFIEANRPALSSRTVTRIKPVDPNVVLKAGIRPLPDYRNHPRQRAMTMGELGCFAAHLGIFKLITEEPDSTDPFLILEGDVLLTSDALSRLLGAWKPGQDIVYLSHKAVSKRSALWTCAYAVSPTFAKRVLNAVSKTLVNHAIPIDELLVALCEASPDISVLLMEPQAASPRADSSRTSSTEKSPVVPLLDSHRTFKGHRVFFLTYASSASNSYHRMLLDSARLFGVPLKVLGADDPWDGGDVSAGPGGGRKLLAVLDEISKGVYLANDIVYFLDGYDVLVNGPFDACLPSEILDHKVVFAGERTCWPRVPGLGDRYATVRTSPQGPDPYLNSGLYVGMVGDLRRVLASCTADLLPTDDDQLALANHYLLSNDIAIDTQSRVFMTVNGKATGKDVVFDSSVGAILSAHSFSRPFAVHFNGPYETKSLMPLAYSLAYWSPDVYGVVYRAKVPFGIAYNRVLVIAPDTPTKALSFLGSRLLQVATSATETSANPDAVLVLSSASTRPGVVVRLLETLSEDRPIVCVCPDSDIGLYSEPGYSFPLSSVLSSDAVALLPSVVPLLDFNNLSESAFRHGMVLHSVSVSDALACPPTILCPHVRDYPELYATELFDNVYKMDLLTPEFCAFLVATCEGHGAWSSGTSNSDSRVPGGYENVPTRDIHVKDMGTEVVSAYSQIFEAVKAIASLLFDGYELTRTHMAFVIKYEATEESTRFLRPHHDASTVTLNVALNDGYEGGGTRFLRHGLVILRPGQALIHPGRPTHKHGALPVTKGIRYVLVAFLE